MAKIHARVTVELEISDDELRQIVEQSVNPDGIVCDYDLSEEDVEKFLKGGCVAHGWDDPGYIPDNWLMFDAVDSGMYDGDEDGLRRKGMGA